MSKKELWKNKLERKSRAVDKELGFDKVTAKNADEWLNARVSRIAQENRERSDASWVQLQAGLEFQRKMSRGVLPCLKETPPLPGSSSSSKMTSRKTMTAARAAQRYSPEQDEAKPSASRSHRHSPGAAKQQHSRRQSPRNPTPPANNDTMPDADIAVSVEDRRQPTATKRRYTPAQNKEGDSEQDDSHNQGHHRKRVRADPLDTNLGPGWDFHLVDGSRPTKLRGNGTNT